MTTKNVNLACFITTLSFRINWKWEMLYEEQNMKALDQCAKIAQSLQHNIRPSFALVLLCFYLKCWMYLTC